MENRSEPVHQPTISSLPNPTLYPSLADTKNVWFCFKTEEEARRYLEHVMKLGLPNSSSLRISSTTAPSQTPYRFLLTEAQFNFFCIMMTETGGLVYSDVNALGLFFIKSLRGDDQNFSHMFFDSITAPNINCPLRVVGKKKYTVDGDGVELREKRKPQYTPQQKEGFSKAQSTSLSTTKAHSRAFRFRSDKKSVLVVIQRENVLLSRRLFLGDRGTVRRFYDFDDEKSARDYFAENHHKILYSNKEFDQYIQGVEKIHGSKEISEPMSRLRWMKNKEDLTSAICIGDNNSSSWFLAMIYADQLTRILKNKNLCKENYCVPIYFYMPGNKLHLRRCTLEAQQFIKAYASVIFLKDDQKEEFYKNEDFEFLYFLPQGMLEEALAEEYNGKKVLNHILDEGYIHIVDLIMDKLSEHDFINLIKKYKLDSVDVDEMLFHASRTHKNQVIDFLFTLYEKHHVLTELIEPIRHQLSLIDIIWRYHNFHTLEKFPAYTRHDLYANLIKQPEKIYAPFLKALIKSNSKLTKEVFVFEYAKHTVCEETLLSIITENPHLDLDETFGKGFFSDIFDRKFFKLAKFLLKERNIKGDMDLLLVRGIINNHYEMAKILITDHQANVNFTDGVGETPLFFATNSPEITKLLIDHKADVNAINNNENSLLHVAENAEVTQLLLNAGANPLIKNSKNLTPFEYNCQAHLPHLDVCLALFKHLQGPGYDASYAKYDLFIYAIENNFINLAKCFKEEKTELLNLAREKCTFDEYRQLYLFAHTHLEANDLFVTHLVKFNAVQFIEEYLEKSNANFNLVLRESARLGRKNIFEKLIFKHQNKIDINSIDENGNSVLILTLRNFNNLNFVEIALQLFMFPYIDVNKKGQNNFTALHYAAMSDHTEVLQILLDKKADINSKNSDGKTPLDFAFEQKKLNSIKTLFAAYAKQQYIADLDTGYYLLCFASINHPHLIPFLIENSLITKDSLQVALRLKNYELIQSILENTASEFMINAIQAHIIQHADLGLAKLLLKIRVMDCAKIIYKSMELNQIEIFEFLLNQSPFNKYSYDYHFLAASNEFKISRAKGLELAIKSKNVLAVSLLLKYGADLKTISVNRQTPLNLALQSGNLKIIKLLIDGGADIMHADGTGKTIFQLAVESNKQEIIDVMLSNKYHLKNLLGLDESIINSLGVFCVSPIVDKQIVKTVISTFRTSDSWSFKQLRPAFIELLLIKAKTKMSEAIQRDLKSGHRSGFFHHESGNQKILDAAEFLLSLFVMGIDVRNLKNFNEYKQYKSALKSDELKEIYQLIKETYNIPSTSKKEKFVKMFKSKK